MSKAIPNTTNKLAADLGTTEKAQKRRQRSPESFRQPLTACWFARDTRVQVWNICVASPDAWFFVNVSRFLKLEYFSIKTIDCLLKMWKTPHSHAVFFACIFFVNTGWCERGDLNSHDCCHTPLKRACLPVPAHSHLYCFSPEPRTNKAYYSRSLAICQQ